MKRPTISLDDILSEKAGGVTFGGTLYDVLAVCATDFQRLMRYDGAGPPDMEYLIGVVRRVIPTLPEEVVARLTLRAITEIVQIAMGTAEQVAEELPNSSGPATPTPPAEPTNASPAP